MDPYSGPASRNVFSVSSAMEKMRILGGSLAREPGMALSQPVELTGARLPIASCSLQGFLLFLFAGITNEFSCLHYKLSVGRPGRKATDPSHTSHEIIKVIEKAMW